jgi:hypothetical protein
LTEPDEAREVASAAIPGRPPIVVVISKKLYSDLYSGSRKQTVIEQYNAAAKNENKALEIIQNLLFQSDVFALGRDSPMSKNYS